MFLFAIGFLFWAFLHSITAASATKTAFRMRFGERAYQGFYRLLYNSFSFLTFLPILAILWTQIPQMTLWTIAYPWRAISMGIQFLALLGLAISLLQTDIWSFLGLRQAARFLKGIDNPTVAVQLVTNGTYRWVRHPLYAFSLLFLWLIPVMTLGMMLFNVLATLYFWIGSIYEERRLMAAFGEEYEEYQMRVPRMLPLRLFSRNSVQ